MDWMGTGLAPLGEGPTQAHLVGLDGKGMPGLAQMLVQRGYLVTGSIKVAGPTADRLRRLGVRVHAGHAPRSVPRSARLLVYSPEVPVEHPDRLSAARVGVDQRSSPVVLADLLRRGVGIAAAGGRKAGIAAAMVGWTLTHAGLDPTVLLGSSTPHQGGSGRLGSGPHVVVDDAEGLGEPGIQGVEVVILHDDSGPSARSSTLRRWVDGSPPGRYVLAFADDGEPIGPIEPGRVEVERYSLSPGHAWWGADVRQDRGCYRFRAFHRGRFALEVRLQVPGRHLVLAALAAVAVGTRVDLTCRAMKEALEEFGGISRGFESRGSYRGVTLVDDEAEDPRGVGDALAVAREAFGGRKIRAAYRPPSAVDGWWPLPSEFVQADQVWVIDGEGPSGASGARSFAGALAASGVSVGRASGVDGAIRELDRHLEPGDVLVTLGAGDVGTIADAFLRRLSSDPHA